MPVPERSEIVHRAIRVTVAASVGFYPFVYAVDQSASALYALFAPVALGILSPIPGSGRQRATVMLRALPVGLVLVTLGTVLAVDTWAAVAGMVVVGFLLAFAAVAGPLPAGAAPGLQLFYILACFPPYAPDELGARLIGLTLGVLLLAACEVYLLPAPTTVTYRELLADAVTLAGRTAAAGAGSVDELRTTGQQLRMSQVPPAERPAGPGRVDRAMAQAGAAARRLLEQLARLPDTPPAVPAAGESPAPAADAASDALLGRVAAVCAASAAALRTGRPPGDEGPLSLNRAITDFQSLRIAQATGPPGSVPPVAALRRQAAVLAIAASGRILETAVRLALDGRRTAPIPPLEFFWYTHMSTARLWWRRLTGNTTLRSVRFQNAVRTALGLSAARLVAGSLDLTHGFWVLLAVLTLGRTTAVETWSAVRSALLGTLFGATAAGGLLIVVGRHTDAYAVVLAPAMLAAFALGPLLGVAWAQALFTLVVSAAFAQIAHTSWQLAEARMFDVLTGSVIGLLCGLLAWPAGARREVRRTMAGLLRAAGPLIPGTVRVLLAPPGGSRAEPATLPVVRRVRLAEAAYVQYQSEPGDRPTAPTDWHAVLITANHLIVGANWLPRFDLPATAVTPEAVAWANAAAERLALTADRVAALCAHENPPPEPAYTGAGSPLGTPGGPPLPLLMDLEHWLGSLTAELAHIENSATRGW